tara:strand:- start:203 stop:1078 length:876 start_codon:yes stop_codon:yes gene_type:complete
MNYILYHSGSLPDHLFYCINSILSVDDDSKVHLITDQEINIPEIEVVNINDYDELKFLKKFKNNLKSNGLSSNPLWITSLERIFFINEYIKKIQLSEFVHFDNDVVIYKPFSQIKKHFEEKEKGIFITPLNLYNLIFGYSYVNSSEKFDLLSNKVKEVVENFKHYEYKYNKNNPLNEMRILSIISFENKGLISELETLPYGQDNVIFDPASYGQFLGGTHQKPKRFYRINFATQQHTVGTEIISRRIKTKFVNSIPYVMSELGDKVELVNLHIHSKELQKFKPKMYQDIVN